ncbi:MAG TPA: UDP-N-acetylglucosamine 2-epimerase (non-hydrolyzing) [Gemmatimonadales bacterium]|jgi:UDP-GlcNAc3NAcA epimerase|nr:UDP-N-acetylglucosamine 2-epimerase (non-hydrolyzing) [Gemmatimonadales bacterium]
MAGPRPVTLFFGTRPQVIKASVIRRAIGAKLPVVAVDTGQHYDYSLHQVHYDQLKVTPPNAYLGVGSGSQAEQTAAIVVAVEKWIVTNRPSLAVVIGDTNSTLACALAAAKQRVPVAHVEAGLRATDHLMAEEINRRCVDAISQVLFPPSESAERTLRRERPEALIARVGDVAYDVLRHARSHLPEARDVVGSAAGAPYVYATLHRAELVDKPELLRNVVGALGELGMPVIFAAHPRTAAAIKSCGAKAASSLSIREPLGYLESLAALQSAAVVVTDSGGLQREAYWSGVPCVTVRTETEWSETVSLGANRLVPPLDVSELRSAVRAAIEHGGEGWDRNAYGDGTAAQRVASCLESYLEDNNRA